MSEPQGETTKARKDKNIIYSVFGFGALTLFFAIGIALTSSAKNRPIPPGTESRIPANFEPGDTDSTKQEQRAGSAKLVCGKNLEVLNKELKLLDHHVLGVSSIYSFGQYCTIVHVDN